MVVIETLKTPNFEKAFYFFFQFWMVEGGFFLFYLEKWGGRAYKSRGT